MAAGNTTPTLELHGVVFDLHDGRPPVDLALGAGQLAFLPGISGALYLQGIHAPARGTIRFQGAPWQDRDVAGVERDRRRIGVVVNPRRPAANAWVSNLDIVDNVMLSAQFAPERRWAQIVERAQTLAEEFGLADGLPTTRPVDTSRGLQLLAQWVRAFLPDPLDLLVLENPLDSAKKEQAEAFALRVGKALEGGAAVLWIADTSPPFANLGLKPDFIVE